MKHYVIVYDIPDDGRRDKVATLLASYGERVQLSVFECWLDGAQKMRLREDLLELIDIAEDAVRFYAVAEEVETLGVGEPLQPPNSYVI